MADIIQIRRGTASQWTTANPVLADGELGFETDTRKGKLGNGVTAWNSLAYSFTGEVFIDQLNGASSKNTPVDADVLPISDSAAGNILKKVSWSNIKATLKTYFDTLYAALVHFHSAGDITSGILSAIRGGTGIGSYTANNYIRALNSTTLEQRTPAQVLSDIGAAASSHNQNASTIQSGTFGSGNFVFPNNLDVNGQAASPTNAKGNSGTGTVTFDWNDGNVQTVTLTGNCTFALSNPKSGASYQIIVAQDGTVRTVNWSTTVKWASGTTPTFTGTSGKFDIITIIYDGTNYYGVISKNH